jgi:hypothetical protein
MAADVVATLHWLASIAPTRLTGTPAEKRVQEAIAERLTPSGFVARWQPFRFPRHIYGSLALHFGLALALLAVAPRAPRLAAAGHLLVALSFFSEAVWRRHLLRKLWPTVATQNLVLTRPADGGFRRRVVLIAHTDSAFTGLMFHPALLRAVAKPPPRFLPFLRKQLALPFVALLAFAGLELAAIAPPPWVTVVLALPLGLVFLFNVEIVVRNRPVPGAADNLSGCAAQIVIGEAWARGPVPGVELVLAFTGAEEAGTGGAATLARSCGWNADDTEILVLDTLSNGALHMLEEGELFRVRIPERLASAAQAAARDAELPEPTPYVVPAGATDALPFLVAGFRAMALTCVDPDQHAPRNYHHPLDTADRVDPVQLEASTRLALHLVGRLADAAPASRSRAVA